MDQNFKTKASAIRKLKGKENWENKQREKANFMYTFVQKGNATKQIWWHFRPTSHRISFLLFSPIELFQIELSEETKSYLRQKSNF